VLGPGAFNVDDELYDWTDAYARPVPWDGREVTAETMASLTRPLLRALPNMGMQLESLRVRLDQLRSDVRGGGPRRGAPAQVAARWFPHVHAVVCADYAEQQKSALLCWAEEDPKAHVAQVYALYAALVGVRTTSGPQGLLDWGLPPSTRLLRFYEYWEHNYEDGANEPRNLFDWFRYIAYHKGDALQARIDRYIAFIKHEWLGGVVLDSPLLLTAMHQHLDAIHPSPLAVAVRALVSRHAHKSGNRRERRGREGRREEEGGKEREGSGGRGDPAASPLKMCVFPQPTLPGGTDCDISSPAGISGAQEKEGSGKAEDNFP
jgi:hypothetical protein